MTTRPSSRAPSPVLLHGWQKVRGRQGKERAGAGGGKDAKQDAEHKVNSQERSKSDTRRVTRDAGVSSNVKQSNASHFGSSKMFFPTSSSRGRSDSRESRSTSSSSSSSAKVTFEETTERKGRRRTKGSPKPAAKKSSPPRFGKAEPQETSPESLPESPKIKRKLDQRAHSVPVIQRSGTRAAGRNIRATEVETPIGHMSRATFDSLPPVLR